MARISNALAVLPALAILAALSANAQSEGEPAQEQQAEAPMIEPAAEERLAAMSDYLGSAETPKFVAVSFFDQIEAESGIRIKRFIVHDVELARPDRLAFTSTFDDGTVRQGWYDGANLIIASPSESVYVEIPGNEGLDALLDKVADEYGYSLPLADILYSDVYAAQEPYLLSAIHLGERTVGAVGLDQISAESLGADWQIWIKTGEEPLPLRFLIQFVEADGAPEYMATFYDWAIDEPIDDQDFVAVIPAEWERRDLPGN